MNREIIARSFSVFLISVGLFINAGAAMSQGLPLVGNKVATFIDVPDNPARAIDAVKAALGNQRVTITATTQAWSGSGLRNGKFNGYIDHYSLNEQKNNYLYSLPYAVIPLHIAGKDPSTINITRLDKIYRQRLGIENRFANTDALRSERSVSWARSPDFFSNIKQLGGQRVEHIIADKYMLEEFNKLLIVNGQEPLFLSSKPIYVVEVSLAVKSDVSNAKGIVEQFNQGLEQLRSSGQLAEILYPQHQQVSLLDDALYADTIRKW